METLQFTEQVYSTTRARCQTVGVELENLILAWAEGTEGKKVTLTGRMMLDLHPGLGFLKNILAQR